NYWHMLSRSDISSLDSKLGPRTSYHRPPTSHNLLPDHKINDPPGHVDLPLDVAVGQLSRHVFIRARHRQDDFLRGLWRHAYRAAHLSVHLHGYLNLILLQILL